MGLFGNGRIKEELNAIDKLATEFPPGMKFNYLGHGFIVVSHSVLVHAIPSSMLIPALRCHYFDNNGVLRETVFEESDFAALREEIYSMK